MSVPETLKRLLMATIGVPLLLVKLQSINDTFRANSMYTTEGRIADNLRLTVELNSTLMSMIEGCE